MKTLNTKQLEKATEFLGNLNTDVDLLGYIDIKKIDLNDPFNSIVEILNEDNGFNVEFIGYYKALEYLLEYDCSLKDSLEIASEYGLNIDGLNSEVLASLLATRAKQEAFDELESEINTFFEEL